MKHIPKEYLQLFLSLTFFLALIYVYGIAGSSDLNRLTAGQAFVRGMAGVAYMAVSVITYKFIGKEE